MATDDEQSIPRRRSRNLGHDPKPIINISEYDTATRDDSNYFLDEGLDDSSNRGGSSAVRWRNSTDLSSSYTTGDQGPNSKRRRTTNSLTRTNSSPKRISGDLPRTTGSMRRQTQPAPVSDRNTTGSIDRRMTTTGRQREADRILNENTYHPRTTPQKLAPDTKKRYNDKHPQENENEGRKIHWLVPAGVGMFAMLVLFILGSSVLGWATQRYNDYEYGMPRTYQTDAIVGHNNDSTLHPSHFIAMNLNHQAIVIEMMASTPAKSVTYVVANIVGDNSSLAPVTLQFRDVNGDKKPDMIVYVHLNGQEQVSVFVNDGSKFRPANSTDKIKY